MAGPKVLRHDLTENKPQMGQAHRSVTAKKFQGFLTTFNPKHKGHRRTSRSENLKIKKNKKLHSEESAIGILCEIRLMAGAPNSLWKIFSLVFSV